MPRDEIEISKRSVLPAESVSVFCTLGRSCEEYVCVGSDGPALLLKMKKEGQHSDQEARDTARGRNECLN